MTVEARAFGITNEDNAVRSYANRVKKVEKVGLIGEAGSDDSICASSTIRHDSEPQWCFGSSYQLRYCYILTS